MFFRFESSVVWCDFSLEASLNLFSHFMGSSFCVLSLRGKACITCCALIGWTAPSLSGQCVQVIMLGRHERNWPFFISSCHSYISFSFSFFLFFVIYSVSPFLLFSFCFLCSWFSLSFLFLFPFSSLFSLCLCLSVCLPPPPPHLFYITLHMKEQSMGPSCWVWQFYCHVTKKLPIKCEISNPYHFFVHISVQQDLKKKRKKKKENAQYLK